jgi:hypothetical protein
VSTVTSAEIDYVVALVRSTNTQREFTWRGYKFLEQQNDGLNYETFARCKYYSGIDTIAWGTRRLSDVAWVASCLRAIKYRYRVWHDPIDDVPWEIHWIQDFRAYVIALEAYLAERSALTG